MEGKLFSILEFESFIFHVYSWWCISTYYLFGSSYVLFLRAFFLILSLTFFSDGTSLCGVFIAVHNVIQQLNIDGYVDVFTVVRQLRIHQPDLCNSVVCIQLQGPLYISFFRVVAKDIKFVYKLK